MRLTASFRRTNAIIEELLLPEEGHPSRLELDFGQKLADNYAITATPPIPLVGEAHLGWLFSFLAVIPRSQPGGTS